MNLELWDSGVFSTGATGAMAPVILRKRLIAPAVSTRNGKILLTLGTRNFKILNTPLHTYACNDLTNFAYEASAIAGNGSYVNLQKLAEKNS